MEDRDKTKEQLVDELQQLRERLDAVTDSALDTVILMNPAGNVEYCNPAAEKMFGYRRDEITGRQIHDTLVPRRYREKANESLLRFAESGECPLAGTISELEALRKDGSEIPIEMSVSPFKLEDRWGAVAIIRDITERKQAEVAIREERVHLRHLLEMYERDRQLMAYEIHDGFTQPLIGALMQFEGCLHDLRNQDAIPEGYESGFRLLRSSIDESRQLMRGLRPPVLDELGVVSAIGDLAAESRTHWKAKIEFVHDVQFDRLVPPLELTVFRIVQESVVNALRHSNSGRVRIRLVQLGDRLQIEVEDWGVGFDLGKIGKDRFGLEGIQERAQLFGGRATIESTPGKGTRITVDLPLVENPSVETNARSSEEP